MTHTLGTWCWEFVWLSVPPDPHVFRKQGLHHNTKWGSNAFCSKQSNTNTRSTGTAWETFWLHAVSMLVVLLFGLPLHLHNSSSFFWVHGRVNAALTLTETCTQLFSQSYAARGFNWQNKQFKVKRSGWMAVNSIESHLWDICSRGIM